MLINNLSEMAVAKPELSMQKQLPFIIAFMRTKYVMLILLTDLDLVV